jgi:ubiquinone/menaquinone biosynthesis C-methylase UbiE
MSVTDPEEQRAALRDGWEKAAGGWGKRAGDIRDWGMPVSAAMVESLHLQPGMTVLELAAGPGDTGFMAAELIRPGGTLIASDGAEAMLQVARGRARELGIDNVEFKQLELEWIDMKTASVDAVLVRWGIMLIVDPEAAAHEVRRILRPGGRAAFAVWDGPDNNPWATIPQRTMVQLGHARPPDPAAPGMFALAADGVLAELLQSAGFEDVVVRPVALERQAADVQEFIDETAEMSPNFSTTFAGLAEHERARIVQTIAAGTQTYTAEDGSVRLPGSSLVASAGA